MLRALVDVYRPAPPAPPLPPAQVPGAWAHWRARMLASMFLAYGLLYFGRKNISGALPVLGRELGYSNLELGLLGSTLYVTYGIGKFANGVLADRSNIRTFMATSLVLSGLANLWFGSLASLWALAFAWGVNGWVQSMGFPPIARALTIWYPPEGRGTRWAIWTTSHQAGTAAVLALTALLLQRTGGDWRVVFQVPGLICIVTGVGLLFSLADTPASKGLPPVASFAGDAHEEGTPYRTLFIRRVLLNRQLWVVAGVNLCVYVIRFGTLDWMAKWLVEQRGYAPAAAAGLASTMPIFGIGGVLAAGWVSDRVFAGRFRLVNALMLAALAGTLGALYAGVGSGGAADFAYLAALGFLVEGPQSLLGGIASVDVGGSARVASAAAGLVGVCGYFGATLSSVGTGWCLDRFGWSGGFAFWTGCALAGFLLCAFAWREPSLQPAPAAV